MNNRKKVLIMIFGLFFIVPSTIGCQIIDSLPFIATSKTPAASLVPARWSVEVISVAKTVSFGEWAFEEANASEFIIVTLQYTYLGPEITEFYPQSVVLVWPEGSSFPGSAMTVTNYQAENSNDVINFMSETSIITYIRPGQTKIEKFGWGVYATEDTGFQLLFPETEPIDIMVGSQ